MYTRFPASFVHNRPLSSGKKVFAEKTAVRFAQHPTPSSDNQSSTKGAHVFQGVSSWREIFSAITPPATLNKLKHAVLLNRWRENLKALGFAQTSETQTNKVTSAPGQTIHGEQLLALYDQPERAYHNLDHLLDLFELYDQYLKTDKPAPKHPKWFELAIWFHDAIDDRHNPNGVTESAQLAKQFILAHSPAEPAARQQQANYVSQLILGTQHATPSSQPPLPPSLDMQLFQDMDLSILGKPEKHYTQYRDAIRTEYDFVPLNDYTHHRTKLLKQFLNRNPLYQLPWFNQRFEHQAKHNLKAEIDWLASQNQ